MRLDAISAPPVKITSGAARTEAAPEKAPELAQGDVVKARVLSVGDGTASLRTEDGALLQARLENGVLLSPGADVYLLVRDSGSDITVMTPINPVLEASVQAQPHVSSPLLNAIFNQLVSLGYEPTEEMMSAMEHLLADVPNMTMQEAAFFAAQKLEAEPAILDAFHAITTGEADTASLLNKLAAVSATLTEPVAQNAAPLTATATFTENTTLPDNTIPVVISESTTPEITTLAAETQTYSAAPQIAPETDLPAFGRWLLEALGTEVSTVDAASTGVLTGATLASSPLLDGLSERSLSGMAESLNRIADSIPKASSETELFDNISKFAKELFVRLDGNDDINLQEHLKEVREDLYIKLAYFRDAVASSGAQAKDVVLEQTQKLMDHLRLLNGLDQFVCAQIPVQLDNQSTHADLYIYKRKKNGSSRIDPENVKILLALDLTHMGQLETMIEILGRDVSLRFEVESDDVANTLRQNTARIHRLLDDAGYKFANGAFVTKQPDTTIETALLALLESEHKRGELDMFL